MLKRIKDAIAALLYHIILLILKIYPGKRGIKHLILVKTDEIGDYFLFRNYFEDIRQSAKYKDFQITLVANIAWKDIVATYDADKFDDIVWIDKKRFNKDLRYRFDQLRRIRNIAATEIVNCVYSRSLLMDDGFAFVSKGRRIAMVCDDTTNRRSYMMKVDPIYYDQIISAGDKTIFDNIRNGNFIRQLLGASNIQARMSLENVAARNDLGNYCVFFIGAGNPERKWPVSHYVETAKYLADRYNITAVICGGKPDIEDARLIAGEYSGQIVDYTGKTTLSQMLELLSSAKLLVSVDTGAVHMAATVKCPVVGLYSGKFFGRFAPYPKEIFDKFYPVYPDFVDELIIGNDPVLYDVHTMKNNTMRLIPPAKVFPYIDQIMSSKLTQ